MNTPDLFDATDDASDLRDLVRRFVHAGKLQAIFLRPARNAPTIAVNAVNAMVDRGLEGDRAASGKPAAPGGSKRQVTLIQSEYMPVIATFAGLDHVDPADLRRNLVVSGINL